MAVVLEMFHNFSLIHDDLADDSHFRRGKPTLHRQYGTGIALNSGDALYTLVWNTLLRMKLPATDRIALARLCSRTFQDVTEGQGTELAWYREGKFNIREKDYFRMVQGKTASLMGLACQIGARSAHASIRQQKELRRFGEKLGLAFQVQDDILNISGSFKKYKKKIGEDITEGKRTLMVIRTLQAATPREKRRMVRIVSSKTRDPKKIAYVTKLFVKYRSLEYAQKKARQFVNEARRMLYRLPETREKKALDALARFVVERQE